MQFIFSASSAFDIFNAEADLSRRAIVRRLPGLSFREYMALKKGIEFPRITIEEIFESSDEISTTFLEKAKPIPLFREYLQRGKQVAGLKNAFEAKDDIETGYLIKVPLWQFGLLY